MKACEGVVNPDEHFDYMGEKVQPSHEYHRSIEEFIEAHKRIMDKLSISYKKTLLSTYGRIIRTNVNYFQFPNI
jgi:hypothetical protein